MGSLSFVSYFQMNEKTLPVKGKSSHIIDSWLPDKCGKQKVVPQFHSLNTIAAHHVYNSTDAVIAEDHQYPSRLATVRPNRTHHCLVDPALCAQWYFTPRAKT